MCMHRADFMRHMCLIIHVAAAISLQAKVPKAPEEAARIAEAVRSVFLFRHLSDAQMNSVVQVRVVVPISLE